MTLVACASCGAELPSGARFCPACAAPVAEPQAASEERKIVTVLFADLVDSTPLAERRDPEDVRAILGPYFARVRRELERFGGTVEKFIGDAVMALFGAPLSREDDAERAVRAAFAVRDAVAELNASHPTAGLQVRIAVHTGEAVIALGARPSEGEGMASGDVVNTAFRLQETAGPGGILVGEVTFRATQDTVEYGDAATVAVKGRREPVVVHEARELRTPTEAGPRLAPLVGRRDELDFLLDTLARVRRERAPQLVTLVGVPGIGKSRLVWELHKALEDPELVRWLRGRCLSYGEGVTFWALAEMVKGEAGILETDSRREAAAKLARAVGQLLPEGGEADWVKGHLRPLVGLGAERTVTPERRQEEFAAWRRFFEAHAERGLLVLVFEDLHWADDGLLDFVDHLADRASSVPLLLLCTSRPELLVRRAGWAGGKRNAATLSLSPLSDSETARLIGFLLRQTLLPAELQQALLAQAEGNPLYAEEYVRMLVDRGFLVRSAAGWDLRAGDLPLPESVQAIIASRLDALPAAEKLLLQSAAVVGKGFWVGTLAAMADQPRSTVEDLLHELERKEFVRRGRSSSMAGETQYGFTHVLVRDVAYGQIPRPRRAEKHTLAARWIESLGRPEDHAELLAYHYVQALEFARAAGQVTAEHADRARLALRDAGERAVALNAFEAAARFLKAALELWPGDDPGRGELLYSYGESLFHARGGGGRELEAARDALVAAGDRERAAEAETMLALLASFVHGEHDAAFGHLDQALALVEDAPPSRAKAYVLSNIANSLGAADEHERALEEARRALAIAEELGLEEIEARCLNTIGWLRATRGDRDGFADLERSIAIARSLNSPYVVVGYVNLAGVHIILGDLRRAFEILAEGRHVAARFGPVHGTNWLVNGLKVFEDYWCGQWDAAVRRADEILADEQQRFVEIRVRIVRGHVRAARGDAAGTLDDSSRSLELARAAKDAQFLYPALAFRARALLWAGRGRDAGQIAEELVGKLRGEEFSMDSFWIDLAATLHSLDRRAQLLDAVEKVRSPTAWVRVAEALGHDDLLGAADLCAAIGSLPDEAFVRLLAAEALERRGEHAASKDQRQRAARFYESVGAEWAPRAGAAVSSPSPRF